VNAPVAEPATGKPLFKASEGGSFGIFESSKDATFGEFRFGKGMSELIRQKVRPEAFPNGSPMAG